MCDINASLLRKPIADFYEIMAKGIFDVGHKDFDKGDAKDLAKLLRKNGGDQDLWNLARDVFENSSYRCPDDSSNRVDLGPGAAPVLADVFR